MARRLVLAMAVLLSLVAGMGTFRATETIRATAPDTEFSAARAMRHVAVVAREPHPMGSAANELVGIYIVEQLAELGLSPEIQETTVPDYFGLSPDGTQVVIRNIVARIPGADSTGSIALVGHYDSVPASPGANDDGSAVATLLETARALLGGSPLRNDVIVLFTDGEEPGQFRFGTRYFVGYHPWAQDIRLVLNFEAIGRTGPSTMFQTGPGNRWLIQGLSQAAPRPVAFSFMSDLYRLAAKGGTDFAASEEAGIGGMDFAYFFGRTVYHTALDNVGSLDERSLQHHGSYALNLTRHFGDLDISGGTTADSGDAVYFTYFGRYLVSYPASWAFVLVALAGILLIGVVVMGLRRRQITLPALAASSLVFLAELVAVTVLLTLAWWGIDELYLRSGTVVEPGFKAHLYFVAFLALSVAMVVTVTLLMARRVGSVVRATGALLCWWVLAVLASLYLPGFGLLFTWPLLVCLPVLGWMLWRESYGKNTWRNVVLLAVSVVLGIVIMAVPVYVFFQAFGVSSPGFSGSPSFPIIGLSVFLWVMLLGLLVPHLEFIGGPRRGRLIALMLVVAVGCLVVGSLVPGISLESLGLARELAEALETDATTAVALCDSLQEKGWLERRPDAGDRRVNRLVLTDAGRAVCAQAMARMSASY